MSTALRWVLLAACAIQAGSTAAGTIRLRTLERVGAAHGLGEHRQADGLVSLRSDAHRLAFAPENRRLLFDGLLLYLNGPTVRAGKHWAVSDQDVQTVLGPLLGATPRHRSTRPLTVVLDPGHGGADPGTAGRHRVTEKAVVLDIARFVRRHLHGCGAVVKLTRNGDVGLSLSDRARRARAWGGDILVSIHVNSAANRAASGVETFVLPSVGFPSTAGNTDAKQRYPGNRHDAANTLLGYYVHKGMLSGSKAPDRGVRRARFQILREAPCPAVLVECGFASNDGEARRLSSGRYRRQLAVGIAQGILTFISRGIEE